MFVPEKPCQPIVMAWLLTVADIFDGDTTAILMLLIEVLKDNKRGPVLKIFTVLGSNPGI